MNFANKLSIGRILIVPFFIASLLYYEPSRDFLRFIALLIFALGFLSDAIDGLIARTKRERTQLGTFLDPIADKLLILSAFICLSVLELPFKVKFPLWVPLTVISRDALIILGVGVIYLIKGKVQIQPSRMGKTATFLQMLTIIVVLLQLPQSAWIWTVAVAFTVVSFIGYIRRASRFLNTERSFRENP